MFRKHHKKLNKRGFTLAESVLALAVIAITSVGVLSLVLSSHRATTAAAQKQQAQLYAADIISCYRVSENDTDFEANIEFALGKTINEDNTIDWSQEENLINLSDDLTALIIKENNTLRVVIKTSADKPLVVQYFTKGGTQNEDVTQ